MIFPENRFTLFRIMLRAAVTQPKIAVPCGDGGNPHAVLELLLVLAVVLGVMPARFGMVITSMAGVTMGAVGVMRAFSRVAGCMVLSGFAVMMRHMLVMFGCLVVVFNACVVAHDDLPVANEVCHLYAGALTLC